MCAERARLARTLAVILLSGFVPSPTPADVCTTSRDPGSPPGARTGHAMAYDSARGVTVLFGGEFYDSQSMSYELLGDTWEWDGVIWTVRIASGPAPR